MPIKRKSKPLRTRKARKDGMVCSIVTRIRIMLDLPKGSVLIVGPSGRKIRSTASIQAVRKLWAESR